jgi:hypothetical protein
MLLPLVPLVLLAAACGGGSSDAASSTTKPEKATTSTSDTTTTVASDPTITPTPDGSDPAAALTARLGKELDDPALAAQVVDGLSPEMIANIEKLAGGDIAGSTKLAYTPATIADEDVDSLWVFSYGFRIDPGSPQAKGVGIGETPPPMDELEPGPVNEALAEQAAAFVKDHPVPIIAQWEVAQVLEEMGVPNVISVEPDVAADGTVTYLSTDGVVQKGLALASDQDVEPGRAGVLCFADHANRCLMTAEKNGLEAAVPASAELPRTYDPQSGQNWTRSRETWIPVDLLGRTVLG